MADPAATFQLDHDGSVIRIIGNHAGLSALVDEMTQLLSGYHHGQTLPLLTSALCIAQGGTDIVELVCDDKLRSEGNS